MLPRMILALCAGLGLSLAAAGCTGGGCPSGRCSVPSHSSSTYSTPAHSGSQIEAHEPAVSSFAPSPVVQGSGTR